MKGLEYQRSVMVVLFMYSIEAWRELESEQKRILMKSLHYDDHHSLNNVHASS
jgi:hypothetical protein